jgi:hypothetical protein
MENNDSAAVVVLLLIILAFSVMKKEIFYIQVLRQRAQVPSPADPPTGAIKFKQTKECEKLPSKEEKMLWVWGCGCCEHVHITHMGYGSSIDA